MKKHQSILKTNKKLAKTFEGGPIISFEETRKRKKPSAKILSLEATSEKNKKQYEPKMSPIQWQETDDVLQTDRENYIFHRLQQQKYF